MNETMPFFNSLLGTVTLLIPVIASGFGAVFFLLGYQRKILKESTGSQLDIQKWISDAQIESQKWMTEAYIKNQEWMSGELNKLEGKINLKFDEVDKKFDKKFDKIDEKFDKIDKKFDKIDKKFDKIDEKFDKVNLKLEEVDKNCLVNAEGIKHFKTLVNTLSTSLVKQNGMPFQASSPMTLTDYGKGLAEKFGAKALVEKHAEQWLTKLAIDRDADHLLIQIACMEFCDKHLWDTILVESSSQLRETIYYTGVDHKTVANIFGLIFRNYVFNQRGIPVTQK